MVRQEQHDCAVDACCSEGVDVHGFNIVANQFTVNAKDEQVQQAKQRTTFMCFSVKTPNERCGSMVKEWSCVR